MKLTFVSVRFSCASLGDIFSLQLYSISIPARILMRNEELRTSLQTEQGNVQQYVNEVQRYKESLQELGQSNEELQKQLKNTHVEYEQKISVLESEKKNLEAVCNAKIVEIQEQCEMECQTLKDEMEMTVQTQVEVGMVAVMIML